MSASAVQGRLWLLALIVIIGICLFSTRHKPSSSLKSPPDKGTLLGVESSDAPWSELCIAIDPELRVPRVMKAAFSGDGRYLIVQVECNSKSVASILVFDLYDLAVRTFPCQVSEKFVSPLNDGQTFHLSPSQDSVVFRSSPAIMRFLGLGTGPSPSTSTLPLPTTQRVTALCFTHDSKSLATLQTKSGGGGLVTVFDLETGKTVSQRELGSGSPQTVAFSSNSRYLAVGMDSSEFANKDALLWLVNLSESTAEGPAGLKGMVRELAFSPDDDLLYAVGPEQIRQWKLPGLEARWTFEPPEREVLQRVSVANERSILVAGNHEVYSLNATTGKLKHRIGPAPTSIPRVGRNAVHMVGPEGGVKSYDLEGQPFIASPLPLDVTRPLDISERGGWISVKSVATNKPVAYLQFLAMDRMKVEWVACNSEGEYFGSPNWRDFATPVWRNPAAQKMADLNSVRKTFLRPEASKGEAVRPSSRPVSRAVLNRNPDAVASLLDEIEENPGAWSQMCSGIPRGPDFSIEIPMDGYSRLGAPSMISAENFERLRDARTAVVKEVGRRLSRLAQEAPSVDPRNDLETPLMILLDLNGVEALGPLLQMENGLSRAQYPDARILRGWVLSVVLAILHNEGAGGLEALTTVTRDSPFRPLATYVEFSTENRDLIVQTARHFLDTVSPADYRAGERMSANAERR